METPIRMCLPEEKFASRSIRSAKPAGLALMVASLLALSGCSSGGSAAKPQVGAIAFTDANAKAQTPLTSLLVSQGTYLDVALTGDTQLLGADWSVSCGSTPPTGTPLPPGQTQDQSCGTFTPTHTMSGPVPSYVTSGTGYVAFYTAPAVPPKGGLVTLYASATSDHTRYSSVSLTINGLPISVGFAPAPPSTLAMSASTQLKAVLNNDATGAGVNWTVICGSSACGSFNPAQTASGVVTTYTAPATAPTGGTVKITATSIADPTRSASATIQIAPVSISVAPASLSVGTTGTGSLTALVVNDGLNKGVDWSVSCTNATTPGSCGTITSHTASGAVATYTAPSVANIAVGATIVATASSTADPTKSATATITTVKGNLVSGTAQAAQQPIDGASVSLYAATTSATALHGSVNSANASAITSAITGKDGSFAIPYGYVCSAPDTPMYLVSAGGNAGGGTNANLLLVAALGPCAKLDASRFVVNEATTVAAVYALSGFLNGSVAADLRIGSPDLSPAALATAFATAADLVDQTTGLTRLRTVSGAGVVPRARINTLANSVHACAVTAGSVPGDGSVCDRLFAAADPEPASGSSTAIRAGNTIQAVLELSREVGGASPDTATLYNLAASSSAFEPMLMAKPADWSMPVSFAAMPPNIPVSGKSVSTDNAANVWMSDGEGDVIEFVGAAAGAFDPSTLPSHAVPASRSQP